MSGTFIVQDLSTVEVDPIVKKAWLHNELESTITKINNKYF
jgi:hypothetical protein